MFSCLLIPSNYCYYQEHHQPDVCQHYLAVSKSLACDGAERHVVVVPPFQESLLHNACRFSYYCALQFRCKVLGVVAGLEPATNGVNDISSLYALPTELHDTPYIFPHTSSWQPHQPTATTAEPIRTIGLAIRILYYSFNMLRCYRNHSAFNSHNLPSDLRYYLPALLFTSRPTRGHCWFGNYLVTSGCTYGLGTVSFHSICIEVSFAAVSAQGFARASPPFGGSRFHHRYGLLATHLAIVYSVYSAYLPGLHSARPSAFVEGDGFEPPCISAHDSMSLLPSSSQPTFPVLHVAMP